MKFRTSRKQGWLIAGALILVQTTASFSAEPADAAVAETGSVTAQTTVRLPYGVEDVLKLSKAQVSENIILSYIQTSGTTYSLGPNDIVYLKQQGVSDGVVSALLDSQRRAAQATQAQVQAAQTAQNPQTYQAAPNAAPATPQYAPVSTATYDQQPAATDTTVYSQPGSSVYTIAYPQATYAYYGGYSYPYYPSYYWGPSIGFSFGYNGCYGYRGCYSSRGCYNNYHNGFYNGVHSGFHGGVHTSGSFSHGVSRASGGFHGGHR
jgi:hypothetical protein